MIRNQYYYSVAGPQGPAGTSINTPNPTTIDGIVTWGDDTGTTVADSTFTLSNPFSVRESNGNNLISIDSSLITIGSNQTNAKIPNILYYGSSTGNLQLGSSNLENNTNGDNCSLGRIALSNLDTNGSSNNAFGNQSMQNANINCYQNCAYGTSSLRFATTDCTGNICIGFYTGSGLIESSNYNVYCGHFITGVDGESGKIRLGSPTYNNTCYVAGIYDNMSPTGDKHPVYCDPDGKLTTTFSSTVIPMGEIYYENPVTDTRTLSVGVATQISVPGGLFYNTQFSSPSNSQLQFTGAYTRYANLNATISCVIDSGTNQLLNFELRKNGSKIPGTGVRVKFSDNTDYQTIS
jgi:hypothetical protein